jgi:hypothetical protein
VFSWTQRLISFLPALSKKTTIVHQKFRRRCVYENEGIIFITGDMIFELMLVCVIHCFREAKISKVVLIRVSLVSYFGATI